MFGAYLYLQSFDLYMTTHDKVSLFFCLKLYVVQYLQFSSLKWPLKTVGLINQSYRHQLHHPSRVELWRMSIKK